MRADLSPQDREGFLHFGYEQTQWASLSSSDEWVPCSPAEDALLLLGTAALALTPVAAFIYFMVF